MHPISDKELDKLYQQHFEELEMEPSANVWAKISDKLDTPKNAGSVSVFWMAAASIILVAGAALWFFQPAEVIRLRADSEMAVTKPEVIPSETAEPQTSIAILREPDAPFKGGEPAGTGQSVFELSTSAVIEDASPEKSVDANFSIASNIPVKKTVTPSPKRQDVKIPARYAGDQSNLDVTQPDMIARVDDPVNEEEVFTDESSRGQKKIRSVGSLVNFVIGKVDKREDKIIEFKDGEEGSEISGINLGLIKLRARK